MDVTSAIIFFLLPLAAFSINVAPKLDFGEEDSSDISRGITPDYIKTILEKSEPSVSPGVVKAVLEVNVGALPTSSKPESKSDKDKKTKKKNKVLICTLDGNCKLHELPVKDSDDDDDEEEDEDDSDKKTLKPIIVSDFDKDPTKDGKDKDDGKGKSGHDRHHGVDRLPVYYGMKLSPAFHQPNQGPIIYEEDTHYPPPHYGSYPSPYYPYEHEVSYLYTRYGGNYPLSGYNEYEGSLSGGRTPSPYNKYHTTGKPRYYPDVSSLHRRVGGGTWGDSERPGVYWPSNEIPRPDGSNWVGSNRPGVYWPLHRPHEDTPTPNVVSVIGKTDFEQVNSDGQDPTIPSSGGGGGEVKVDGKLGEPLDKNESA